MRLGRPQTLRFRLVLAAAGSILVAVVLFGVATVLVVGTSCAARSTPRCASGRPEVAELAVSAPAVLNDPGALESPVSGRQIAVEVIDARGRILARSLTLGARLLPEDRLGAVRCRRRATGFENISLDGQPFRLYAAPIALSGPRRRRRGAGRLGHDRHLAARPPTSGCSWSLSGVGVALLAALLAAALTRRGLRPLRRLADAAGEIERTADPSRRLPARGARTRSGS